MRFRVPGYISSAITVMMVVTMSTGSAASAAASSPPSCPAHWSADDLPVPPAPMKVNSRIESVTALSQSDAWMVTTGQEGSSYVYHLDDGAWEGPIKPVSGRPFYATSIVARSDSDVWVTGTSSSGKAEVWHYDGSAWANESPDLSSSAELAGAALGSNGILYVAGFNYETGTAMVWAYDGSRWSDVSPANPPQSYDSLAITPAGTLVAVGLGPPGNVLQERSAGAWTTIPVPAGDSLSDVTAAPGGTVYAVGSGTAGQPILVEQQPGARSVTVLDAPVPESATTFETGVVAGGPGDVWLLGEYAKYGAQSERPWITHFNGHFFTTAAAPQYGSRGTALGGGALLGSAVLAYGTFTPPGPGDTFPKLLAVCPVQLTGTSFRPADKTSQIGDQVFWSAALAGTARHDLVVPGMFNSGQFSRGGSYSYRFFAAGTYHVRDSLSGALGTVAVPVAAIPARGATSTVFTITAASVEAPVGYAYRILVERPGSHRYALLTTTSQPAITFIPGAGTGIYRFEAEVRTPAGLTAPSPAVQITVS